MSADDTRYRPRDSCDTIVSYSAGSLRRAAEIIEILDQIIGGIEDSK